MLSPKEQERIECRFAAFCKVVLCNAVCTYFRDLGRKRKYEISYEYLTEQTSFEASSTDDYFVSHDTPTDFVIYGQLVTVDNEQLANALLCLSGKYREIILLYYFLRYKHYQIAALLKRPRTTVNYQRQTWRNVKMKSRLIPYKTIEKAVGGDTASLLAIQQHYKKHIAYLATEMQIYKTC